MGRAPLRSRHHALDRRPGRRREHHRPPGLARRSGPLHAPDPGPRGLRRRGGGGGLRYRGRDGHGRLQPRPGRPPSDLRPARGLSRPAGPRLDRPGRRRGHGRRPRSARDAVDRREQVGDHDGAAGLPRGCLGSRRARPAGARCRRPEAGRILRGDLRPRQEHRGDHPSRRVARGLPEPPGHRRALLGPQLRRPRARVPHRHRPRLAARRRHLDARALPRTRCRAEPRPPAGARHGRPRPRRPRQADDPRRPGNRDLRGLGGAAHRRVHRQARRGRRADRPGAAA